MRRSEIAKYMLQRDSRKRYDGSINVQLSGTIKIFKNNTDTNLEEENYVLRPSKDFERFLRNGSVFYAEKTYIISNYLIRNENEIVKSNIYLGKNTFNATQSFFVDEVVIRGSSKILIGNKLRIPEILFRTRKILYFGDVRTQEVSLISKIADFHGGSINLISKELFEIGNIENRSIEIGSKMGIIFNAPSVNIVTQDGSIFFSGIVTNVTGSNMIFYGIGSSNGIIPNIKDFVNVLKGICFNTSNDKNKIYLDVDELKCIFENKVIYENTNNEELLFLSENMISLKNILNIMESSYNEKDVRSRNILIPKYGVYIEEDLNITRGGLYFKNSIISKDVLIVGNNGRLYIKDIINKKGIECGGARFSLIERRKRDSNIDSNIDLKINEKIIFTNGNINNIETLKTRKLYLSSSLIIENRINQGSYILIDKNRINTLPENDLIVTSNYLNSSERVTIGNFILENSNIELIESVSESAIKTVNLTVDGTSILEILSTLSLTIGRTTINNLGLISTGEMYNNGSSGNLLINDEAQFGNILIKSKDVIYSDDGYISCSVMNFDFVKTPILYINDIEFSQEPTFSISRMQRLETEFISLDSSGIMIDNAGDLYILGGVNCSGDLTCGKGNMNEEIKGDYLKVLNVILREEDDRGDVSINRLHITSDSIVQDNTTLSSKSISHVNGGVYIGEIDVSGLKDYETLFISDNLNKHEVQCGTFIIDCSCLQSTDLVNSEIESNKIICRNVIKKDKSQFSFSWDINNNSIWDDLEKNVYVMKLFVYPSFKINGYEKRVDLESKKGSSYILYMKIKSVNGTNNYFYKTEKIYLLNNENNINTISSKTINIGYSQNLKDVFDISKFEYVNINEISFNLNKKTSLVEDIFDEDNWEIEMRVEESFDSLPNIESIVSISPGINTLNILKIKQDLGYITLRGESGINGIANLSKIRVNEIELSFDGNISGIEIKTIFTDLSNNFNVSEIIYDEMETRVTLISSESFEIEEGETRIICKFSEFEYAKLNKIVNCDCILIDYSLDTIDVKKQIYIANWRAPNNTDSSKNYAADVAIHNETTLYYLSNDYVITKITLVFDELTTISGNKTIITNTDWTYSINIENKEIIFENTSIENRSKGLSIAIGDLSTDANEFVSNVKIEGFSKEIGDLTNLDTNTVLETNDTNDLGGININLTNYTYFYYREDDISSKYFSPINTRIDVRENYLIYTSNEYAPTNLILKLNATVLNIVNIHGSVSEVNTIINDDNTTEIEISIDNVNGEIINDGNEYKLLYIDAKNIVDKININVASGYGRLGNLGTTTEIPFMQYTGEFYFEANSYYIMEEDKRLILSFGKSQEEHELRSYPVNGVLSYDEKGEYLVEIGINIIVPSQIYYIPNINYNGIDNFEYKTIGEIRNVNVKITIEAVNDIPIPVSFGVTDFEDTVMTVVLRCSDIETTLDMNYKINTNTMHGNLYEEIECINEWDTNSILKGGSSLTIYYRPFENYYGNDIFDYSVEDSSGGISGLSAIVSLNIISVNDIPFVIPFNPSEYEHGATFETIEDTVLQIILQGDDVDEPKDDLQFEITEMLDGSMYSTETMEPENELFTNTLYDTGVGRVKTIYFLPSKNFFGNTTFIYRAKDSFGDYSAPYTVTIFVHENDHLPVPNNIFETVLEDVRTKITLTAIDGDDEEITKYRIIKLPSNADGVLISYGSLYADEYSEEKLTVNSEVTDSVWFQTNLNLNNPEPLVFFRFRAQQSRFNKWSSLFGTVIINIQSVNDAPTGESAEYQVAFGIAEAITLEGSDDDEEDNLVFEIMTIPSNGRLYSDIFLTNIISINQLLSDGINKSVIIYYQAETQDDTQFSYRIVDNGDPNLSSEILTVNLNITTA
jgi:hypothetical protein